MGDSGECEGEVAELHNLFEDRRQFCKHLIKNGERHVLKPAGIASI